MASDLCGKNVGRNKKLQVFTVHLGTQKYHFNNFRPRFAPKVQNVELIVFYKLVGI
jgi:hypothetical protein